MAMSGSAASRFPSLLDQLKMEFDSLYQQYDVAKMERDELERKMQAQVGCKGNGVHECDACNE